MFGFSQYSSLAQVDSAVASVEMINGNCNAEDAFDQCGTELFSGDNSGRSRVLVVLMAVKSAQNVSRSAGSLKTAGVKIIAIGMGGSVDKSELSTMAFSSSNVKTAASFAGLRQLDKVVSPLVSQGIELKFWFSLSLQLIFKLHILLAENRNIFNGGEMYGINVYFYG